MTTKMLPLAALLLGLVLLAPLDSPAESQQEWIYIVVQDDTLWDLSRKYLPSVNYWKRFQKLNGIRYPKRLKPGTELRIPLAWLSAQPVPAQVLAVSGAVERIPARSNLPQTVSSGDRVLLGDTLRTGPDASVSVAFADGSVVAIRQQTRVIFDHLSAYSDTGMVDTRLRLPQGRVDIRARPAVGPGSRFEIHTPAAVSAVRGTDYRTAAREADASTRVEVLEGKVAATGVETTRLVPAGFGTRVVRGEPPLPPRPLLQPPQPIPLPEVIRQLNRPLSWQPLQGAQQYHIEISSQADFSLLLWERYSERPRVALPDLADGAYWLRLRGIDALGLEGMNRVQAFMLDARPRPPLALAPVDGTVIRGRGPQLRWTRSAEAASYRLQVATDARFSEPLLDKDRLNASAFELEELATGSYHWRVASLSDAGEQGPFGPPRRFEIKPVPQQPITQLDEDDTRILVSWQAGAADQTYQVQVAEDPAFERLLLDQSVAEPQVALSQVKGLVRYLRVRIIEPDGYRGPWGAVQQVDPLPDRAWIYVFLGALLGMLLL